MEPITYFEDFYVGLTMRTVSRLVPEQEIVEFAKVWDPQPFHIDPVAAANSVFGRISACSSHIFAIMNQLAPELAPMEDLKVIAGLGFNDIKLHLPLYAGDEVYLVDETIETRRSRSQPDRGIVSTHGRLFNQEDVCIAEIKSAFLMECRERHA